LQARVKLAAVKQNVLLVLTTDVLLVLATDVLSVLLVLLVLLVLSVLLMLMLMLTVDVLVKVAGMYAQTWSRLQLREVVQLVPTATDGDDTNKSSRSDHQWNASAEPTASVK